MAFADVSSENLERAPRCDACEHLSGYRLQRVRGWDGVWHYWCRRCVATFKRECARIGRRPRGTQRWKRKGA